MYRNLNVRSAWRGAARHFERNCWFRDARIIISDLFMGLKWIDYFDNPESKYNRTVEFEVSDDVEISWICSNMDK